MNEDFYEASAKAGELAGEAVELADEGRESRAMAYGLAALSTALIALASAINQTDAARPRRARGPAPHPNEHSDIRSYRLPQDSGSITLLDSPTR